MTKQHHVVPIQMVVGILNAQILNDHLDTIKQKLKLLQLVELSAKIKKLNFLFMEKMEEFSQKILMEMIHFHRKVNLKNYKNNKGWN